MQPVINPNIDTLIKKGEKHLKKGQFEDALRIFDYALKLDGKNEKLLEYKSIALYELDRFNKACECLEQIVEINPEKKKWLTDVQKNPEIQRCDKLLEDAEILVADQQFEKAISNYQEVIKSDPMCTDAYMNIGICYDYRGDYSSAIDFLDMVLELYPLYPKAWLNKAITYQHKGDIADASPTRVSDAMTVTLTIEPVNEIDYVFSPYFFHFQSRNLRQDLQQKRPLHKQ